MTVSAQPRKGLWNKIAEALPSLETPGGLAQTRFFLYFFLASECISQPLLIPSLPRCLERMASAARSEAQTVYFCQGSSQHADWSLTE